jgi:hypothetical protein
MPSMIPINIKHSFHLGQEIFRSPSGKFRWTHLRKTIYIKDKLKWLFYMKMCRIELWSTQSSTLSNAEKKLFESIKFAHGRLTEDKGKRS